MFMPMLRHCCLTLAAAALLVGTGPTSVAAAGHRFEWNERADRVSADLLDVPVKAVLEQIHIATGWEIRIEPGVNFEVSTSFQELKSARALERLLGTASYAVISRPDAPPRLLVFESAIDRATERLMGVDDPMSRAIRIEDEWIIFLKPGEDAEELAGRVGARITGRIPELNAVRLKFESAQAAQAARSLLESDPAVAGVHENYEINRPAEGRASALGAPKLPKLIPADGAAEGRLVVAFIDTAVQPPTGDMAKFFLPSIQLAGEYVPPPQPATHSTMMHEAALQAMAQRLGAGSAANVGLLNVDIYGAGGDTSLFMLAQGLIAAANAGASIINVSGGAAVDSAFIDAIVARIYASGKLVVAAAGNDGGSTRMTPSPSDYALSVTASDGRGGVAWYANMNETVDVAAPGVIVSSMTGQPTISVGTSVATAYTSGDVAAFSLQHQLPVQESGYLIQQANPAPQTGTGNPKAP
ncbi:MAG TPA: hypothetical protein DCY13_21800 [Verrucomicrobiales bacterium]|nr:hypothetical protein [Verrucomicrobiales bacterium]